MTLQQVGRSANRTTSVLETLAELNVEQHPDKTLIGRVERGLDFLGSVMKLAGLEMARRAVEHEIERVSRLNEHPGLMSIPA